MASEPAIVASDIIDKSEFQISSTDVSKTSKTKYSSIYGVEDGDAIDDIYCQANPPRPGFTKYDQKDMYRMGKVQEFRVRLQSKIFSRVGFVNSG